MMRKFNTEADLYEGMFDHNLSYTQNLRKLLNNAGIMIQATDDIDRWLRNY